MINGYPNQHFKKRILTSVVGMFFFFSMVAAQLPHCQCGIWCLHLQKQVEESVSSAPVSDDHGCCPSKRQGDAPAPKPEQDTPCNEDGNCSCPVELDSSNQVPVVPPYTVVTSVEFHPEFDALPENSEDFSTLTGIEDAPRWRPTRGSTSSRPPLFVLNSVYII